MAYDLNRLGQWAELSFFADKWPAIERALNQETRLVLPPANLRFAALEAVSPKDTRVVILGQDPYPTPGHANGLAFSVTAETPLPRSLRNIYAEMEADLGQSPRTGDLEHLSAQGVLLLNTALSVPAGGAGAHAKLGWSDLTRDVLARVSEQDCAFVLWGKHAQSFRDAISPANHLIIETAHPSPLSARRGFFGSRPFSRINAWLQARGEIPVNWFEKPSNNSA